MNRIITFLVSVLAACAIVSAEEYEIISTQPEGEVCYYDRVSYGWYIFAGGNNLQYGKIPGASKIVWGTDGYVYFQDPLTANKTGNYIRASVEGNKIVAQFPQVLTMLEDNDGSRPLFIGKMDTMKDQYGITYLPVEENDFISWTIHEDGSITMDHEPVALDNRDNFVDPLNPPDGVLGVYYYGIIEETGEEGAIWNAVADWAQTYTPVQIEETLTIPEGLNVEDWRMTSKSKTAIVQVAFDGDIAYIGNITEFVDGAIKGYVEGDKVIFPTTQYIGFNDQYNSNAWFISAIAVYKEYFDKLFLDHFDRTDALVFTYDREKKTLTSDPNACFLINSTANETAYFEYLVDPCLQYLEVEGMNANPLNPVIINPGTPDGTDGLLFSVDIPATNVDGMALNTNYMYYNIYLNGERWTFCTDTYFNFKEDLTDIPYNFTDKYDLVLRGTVHDIYFQEEGIERIGIVSYFRGTDGVIYESDYVEADLTALGLVKKRKEVVEEKWLNLAGQPVENPANGFFIKVTTYSDGSIETQKTALK